MDITIAPHAEKRWRERAPPMGGRGLTESTWLNADPVQAPEVDGDQVRLVRTPEGRDILLVAHEHGAELVISTVLYADHDRLR